MFRTICFFIALFLPQVGFAFGECSGKYDAAREMLDAAYGKYRTLYSGGRPHRALNEVGASIDLYRLWKGLPDARFRDVKSGIYGEWASETEILYPKDVSEAIFLNAIQNWEAADLPEAQRWDIAASANLLTAVKDEADWFLRPDDVPEYLTNHPFRQASAAKLIAQHELLTWLQVIIEPTSYPNSQIWWLSRQNATYVRHTASRERLARYTKEQTAHTDALHWKIAQVVLMPGSEGLDMFDSLRPKIQSCEASASEYAAYAVWSLRQATPVSRDFILLSDQMQKLVCEQYMIKHVQSPPSVQFQDYVRRSKALEATCKSQVNLSWYISGLAFHAKSEDEFIALHSADLPFEMITARQLNLLSTDTLVAFANNRPKDMDAQKAIISVAYGRYISLGRYQEAQSLIPRLKDLYPESAEWITQIANQRLPADVMTSLIALEIEDVSEWITTTSYAERYSWRLLSRHYSRRSRDMPIEYRTGMILHSDLRYWMIEPSRQGSSVYSSAYSRERGFPELDGIYAFGGPSEVGHHQQMPFSEIIAWDELGQFGAHRGLSHKISSTLIDWVDQESSGIWAKLFKSSHEGSHAQTLRQIVFLGRKSYLGERNGKPLGQVAFALLHSRFGDTEAAADTPYWYLCNHRCDK